MKIRTIHPMATLLCLMTMSVAPACGEDDSGTVEANGSSGGVTTSTGTSSTTASSSTAASADAASSTSDDAPSSSGADPSSSGATSDASSTGASIDVGEYLLASLQVTDFEGFQSNYGAAVFPLITAAGGEVLVATPDVDLLEGDYSQNWTVVVRFPDAAAASAWYDSRDYQALIEERHATTDTDTSFLLFAPEFDPSTNTTPDPDAHYLLASLTVEDSDAFQTNYAAGVFALARLEQRRG